MTVSDSRTNRNRLLFQSWLNFARFIRNLARSYISLSSPGIVRQTPRPALVAQRHAEQSGGHRHLPRQQQFTRTGRFNHIPCPLTFRPPLPEGSVGCGCFATCTVSPAIRERARARRNLNLLPVCETQCCRTTTSREDPHDQIGHSGSVIPCKNRITRDVPPCTRGLCFTKASSIGRHTGRAVSEDIARSRVNPILP